MIRAILFAVIFIITNSSLFFIYPFVPGKSVIYLSIYFAGTGFMCYMLFYPRSRLLVPNRSKVKRVSNNCIALTFDDGPSSENTSEILKILRQKNVKATFFIIGNKVEKYHQQVMQLVKEGHVLANHTYSHPHSFCFLFPGQLEQEIQKCNHVIEKITGEKPRLFRSPVGFRHPMLKYYLEKEQLEYISWRQRAFDTIGQDPGKLKNRLLKKINPGDIIILHDGSKPEVKNMLAMLPSLIDELKNRGFKFVIP